MSRACAAPGCENDVVAHRLMCLRHWILVPIALRNDVWRTYRRMQLSLHRPKAKPCEQLAAIRKYNAAREAAVQFVDQQKGL